MAHAICTTQCYYGEREFLVGEILHVGEGEIPAHFAAVADDLVQGQRVYSPLQPRKKPAVASPFERAQAGEKVTFSELNGTAKTGPVKDPIAFSDLI